MKDVKVQMISTTALAVVMAVGVLAAGSGKAVHACRPGQLIRLAANACRPNPCAAKKGCNPCAAKKACNPCAARKACNPCTANKACSPCAAGNPCNPCVAAGVATECVIPRLVAEYRGGNPCAAKKPCNPCKPCGANNACSPCAAKKACNPCAAKKSCSPCEAKKACNPCAVKKACNPCAAKEACNPCNPCAAGMKEPPELSDAEAVAGYDCVSPHMAKAYRKSCHPAAVAYRNWSRFSRVSYPAEAHGVRFMNNYANEAARIDYGKWEAAGDMPGGSVLAKDSFIVGDDGKISVGPLFLMTKGVAGSNAAMRDWQYTMIMPSGSVRQDAAIQKFCNDCHRRAGAEDDYLMFLPLPFRVSAGTGN